MSDSDLWFDQDIDYLEALEDHKEEIQKLNDQDYFSLKSKAAD